MKLSLALSILLLLFAGCASMPDGYGTYTDTNGEYSGEWLNGKRNGKGITRWSNGDVYEGEWLNDMKHGKGTTTWGSESEWVGDKYEGEFKNDIRHGYGIYTFASGHIYKGLWKKNYQTVGIEYLLNGDRFNTSYFNPLTKEAIGDYYYADGNAVKDAYFKNGVLVEANYTRPDGDIFNTRFVGDEVIVETNTMKGLRAIGNILSGIINVGVGLALMKAEYETGITSSRSSSYRKVRDCKFMAPIRVRADGTVGFGRYVCRTVKN